MNFSSRIRGFSNLHLSNLDQHVLGAPSGHRRPDFRSYGSACCTCSGTCQRLGEGKGRGKLASDREGSVTCHMGTQFCFRVYACDSVKARVVHAGGWSRLGCRRGFRFGLWRRDADQVWLSGLKACAARVVEKGSDLTSRTPTDGVEHATAWLDDAAGLATMADGTLGRTTTTTRVGSGCG
ncbi:hypothetical protein E6C27_scaffold335G00650 [Cucumis melo var. makuwa]|uniref:Uncharacterized protein n=1 Tax=Cucumis melo var. makuwa TaxID=1194695 RepID=A0A5A7TQW3_CUCMM|nr:hypothetical protein E6C27_scaffold335G00650 [Cucumis melo var. makuwa]